MEGPPSEHIVLEETSPHLAAGKVTDDNLKNTGDLVEKVDYLYVRVVEAKDLPQKDVVGTYVEVNLGKLKGRTHLFEKKSNPVWSQVFTFTKDHIDSSVLEATVKSKNDMEDHYIGQVLFDIAEVSSGTRLAPQWYRLEDKKGNMCNGQLMLAVWWGTQADEAFSDSWHVDAATSDRATRLANFSSKVYLSPKLWYLRVHVIEAEGLMATDKTFVKAILGNQTLRTRVSVRKSSNPLWNEELMFVAAEPFEEPLILSVEDKVEVLGRFAIPLQYVDMRLDHIPLNSKWYNLEKERGNKEIELARIHLRICFEGGYHVFDESTHYSSDLRPTEEQLWKSSIGVLEVGILNARYLSPMKAKDGRGTTDAYCVAKYGQKWVRTRTITDSLAPKWNEQYTWEVFDPCTVITIGVFDNCQCDGDEASRGNDSPIGKVRIRLSTLETDRVYTYPYPLLLLRPSGVRKMGEIHLAVRFTCSSLNIIHMYSQPQLPKMHYVNPLTASQIESLKHVANCIVSMKLSWMEPPLQKQVVHFMLDSDISKWSVRRGKAVFFRIMAAVSGLFVFARWFKQICYWKNPLTTILVHILFLAWVLYPVLFLPTIFLYLFFIGVSNYRWRPRSPPHIDIRLSCAEFVHLDELDEEFDTFPTTCPADLVRMRYDRIRSIAGRILLVAELLAISGERLQSLLSWRDPRATAVTVLFCLVAAIVLYYAPLQVALLTVFYMLRHPKLRQMHPTVPCLPLNFFRRLPTRQDCML